MRLKHTREWLIFSTVAKLVNGHSDNRVCLKVDIQVANPIPDTWQFLEITFKVMSQQVYVWDTSTHLLLPPPIQQLSSGWSHFNPSVSGYDEGSCCRHVITAIYLPVSSSCLRAFAAMKFICLEQPCLMQFLKNNTEKYLNNAPKNCYKSLEGIRVPI